MTNKSTRPSALKETEELEVLLSGGGFRGMFASVGVVLYLIHRGLWPQVRRVVSVSGGSVTNGALVAMWTGDEAYNTHSDMDRLRELVNRLGASPLNPLASTRRTLIMVRFLLTLAGLVAVFVLALQAEVSWLPSWLLPLLAGITLGPALIQFVRSYITSSVRSYIETVTGGRNLSIAVAHSALISEGDAAAPSRQHVFCATGLVTGRPYYFWVGGAGHDHKAAVGDMLWGSPLPPHNEQNDYTIGEVAFASSSLPLVGNVMSPRSLDLATASRFSSPHRELLVDGGGSGILGQQVRDQFVSEVAMTGELDTVRTKRTTIAVDCFRHIEPPNSSLKTRLLGMFRRKVSSIAFLLSWVKLGSEALYVGDLVDAKDDYLIRVCEPAEHLYSPSELSQVPESVTAAYRKLRTRVNALELYNKTPSKVADAIAAGFIGASIAIEPENIADLDNGLKDVGRALYGLNKNDDGPLYKAWKQVGGTS